MSFEKLPVPVRKSKERIPKIVQLLVLSQTIWLGTGIAEAHGGRRGVKEKPKAKVEQALDQIAQPNAPEVIEIKDPEVKQEVAEIIEQAQATRQAEVPQAASDEINLETSAHPDREGSIDFSFLKFADEGPGRQVAANLNEADLHAAIATPSGTFLIGAERAGEQEQHGEVAFMTAEQDHLLGLSFGSRVLFTKDGKPSFSVFVTKPASGRLPFSISAGATLGKGHGQEEHEEHESHPEKAQLGSLLKNLNAHIHGAIGNVELQGGLEHGGAVAVAKISLSERVSLGIVARWGEEQDGKKFAVLLNYELQ